MSFFHDGLHKPDVDICETWSKRTQIWVLEGISKSFNLSKSFSTGLFRELEILGLAINSPVWGN